MASYIDKLTDLVAHGPLIAVKLWVPQAVKTTLPPIDALAEINTSAMYTYIQEGVATSLGLQPIGPVKITTATKLEYESYKYRIRLVFPGVGTAIEVEAIEIPYMLRKSKRIKCMIGRDILQLCTLTYDGRANTFSLDLHVGS